MEVQNPVVEASPEKSCALGRDERCPLCARDNRCRVAKGHLYKGPCWCHRISVPQHILRRLAADFAEPACLCRPCLETIARLAQEKDTLETILSEARKLMSARTPEPISPDEPDFYLDANGNTVFTAAYHLRRGSCCDNGCLHCPY